MDQVPQWIRDKIKEEKDGSKTGGVEVVVASVEGIESHHLDFQRACIHFCHIIGTIHGGIGFGRDGDYRSVKTFSQ